MPLPRVPLLAAATAWVKEAATGLHAGWRAFFFLKRVAIDDWSWAEGAEMFLIYLDYSPDTLAKIKRMGLVVLGGVLAFVAALAAIAYFVWRRKSSAITERVTALTGRNTVLKERNSDLTGRNILLERRSTFLSWRNTFLTGRNTSLAGRITVLVERNAVLTWCKTFQAERHASLAVRNSVLTERNNVLTGSNAILTERNAELTGYLNDAEETISIILEKGWLVPSDSTVSTSSRNQHGAARAAFQRRGDATKLGTGEKQQVEGIENLGTDSTDSTGVENSSPRRAISSGNGHGGHKDNTRCKVISYRRSTRTIIMCTIYADATTLPFLRPRQDGGYTKTK